ISTDDDVNFALAPCRPLPIAELCSASAAHRSWPRLPLTITHLLLSHLLPPAAYSSRIRSGTHQRQLAPSASASATLLRLRSAPQPSTSGPPSSLPAPPGTSHQLRFFRRLPPRHRSLASLP
ncbi:unnamed protein product, partial [Tilletia caries]